MAKPGWILIDGYNLMYASGVFGRGGRTSLESSREALLDWLARVLSEAQRKRTTIVFDAREAPPGLPKRANKHGLRIRFAPRHSDADEVLEELIREHSSPRQLTVVSGDHRLHRAARRRKAKPIDSERWVAELHVEIGDDLRSENGAPEDGVQPENEADSGKPLPALDADELRDMLKDFGAG